MYQDRVVLCASSAYEKKYYLNEAFSRLPNTVKEELRAMCILFTEDVGGILVLYYGENGTLYFETSAKENDMRYDDIGSGLKIKELQEKKAELLQSLELYYAMFL